MRKTITIQPDEDVLAMLERAIRDPKGNKVYGFQSHIVNEALREHLTKQGFARKRDGGK